MRFNLGRGAAVVAAALCASAAWAGTASAEPEPEWTTITTITASPDRVAPGDTVTYTVTVTPDAVSPSDFDPSVGGTVSLKDGSTPIAACQDVTVTNGTATCSAPATLPSGTHYVTAFYLGDETFAPSDSVNPAEVYVYNEATIVGSAAPNPVERLTPIIYTGIVDGIRVTSSGGGAPAASYGTVSFAVDGQPVGSCQDEPLTLLSLSSTCPAIAPATAGEHTLTVTFSGDSWSTPATHTSTFTVLAPAVSGPTGMDFGSVEVGKTSQRSITLTNSGTLPVKVNSVAVTGPFAATADSCNGKTLAVGATCAVVTTYTASAVGVQSGSLTFDVGSGLGKRTTMLAGTGTVAAVPPTPTVTPPPAPQPGGTFAPGKKPTLTVSAPSSSNPSATPTVQVPLSCPASEECDLSGQLTISSSAFARAAHSAAAGTTKIAHFSGVQVKAGGLKTVKLKLSKAFIKKAQKRGVRRIQATLTVTTVFGNGQTATTKQQVTVVIPKAPKRKAAAKVAPRFTG